MIVTFYVWYLLLYSRILFLNGLIGFDYVL